MDPNSNRLFTCDFEVVHKGLKTPHGFQFILYCSDLCELTCSLCFIPDNPEFLHIGFPSSLHHLGIFLVEILLLPEMGIAYRGDFGGKRREASFLVDASILRYLGLGLLVDKRVAAPVLESEIVVPLLECRVHVSAITPEKFQELFPGAGQVY